MVLQGCKRLFMYRTLIGFLRGDELRVEQGPQGVVQALHAEEGTAFEHAGDLVCFAFTDEVSDSGIINQYLAGRDLSMAVSAAYELLRNDAAQGCGQHGANARLLAGREDIDNAVNRCRGAIRMQGGEDEETCFRRGDSQTHGLQVTQLTHQDDVWILAQGGVQRCRKAGRVHPYLTVAH